MSNPQQRVQQLWNYSNILRDDGLSFRLHPIPARRDGDYVEQLTYLLFLKMADEHWPHYPTPRPPPASGITCTGHLNSISSCHMYGFRHIQERL